MCAQRTAHTPPTDSARLRVWRVQTHTRSSMVTYDGRRYDVDRDATTGDLTTPTNGGEDERWVSSNSCTVSVPIYIGSFTRTERVLQWRRTGQTCVQDVPYDVCHVVQRTGSDCRGACLCGQTNDAQCDYGVEQLHEALGRVQASQQLR
jgi:hypothetical protein